MKIMKSTVNVSTLSRFFNEGKKVFYKKNETIVPRETDRPKFVYYVKKGYVHQYTITATKTINMNIFKPHMYFPLINVFGNIRNKYSYEAITDVEAYAVSRHKFFVFVKNNPNVLYDLAGRLSESLNMMSQVIESLMSFDSSDKVIRILLSCALRFGVIKNSHMVINVPLTHADIANMIGISRETVTRELVELTKLNLVKKVKDKYVLNNVEELRNRIKD